MKKFLVLMVMAVSFMMVNKAEATSWSAYTGVSPLGNLSASVFQYFDIYQDMGTGVDPEYFKAQAFLWDVSFAYGFANNSDFYFSPKGWGVIRNDLSKGNSTAILGLYLDIWDTWGLHYHGKFTFSDSFALEVNVKATTTYGDAFDTMDFAAVIAPVIGVGNASLYLEIDPGYHLDTVTSANSYFDMKVIPGVAFGLGKGYFSVGVEVANLLGAAGNMDVNLKSWYWFDFGIDKIGYEEVDE